VTVKRLAVVALTLALGFAVTGVAVAEGPTLAGSVGPGYSISLRDAAGIPVTSLAAGPVTFDVDDKSEEHNFHLVGPGVDVSTAVEEVARRSLAATLADGTYRFFCDPHPTRMRGQFVVGTGGSSGGSGGTGGTGGTGGSTSQPPTAPVGATLVLTSGPGFTISLKTRAGKKVTRLRPGRYTILVRDRSGIHNAHILGAGVNRRTPVPGTATQTWRVVLKKGTLTFQCDPHASSMRGRVVVAT
jgi:plastocyanin